MNMEDLRFVHRPPSTVHRKRSGQRIDGVGVSVDRGPWTVDATRGLTTWPLWKIALCAAVGLFLVLNGRFETEAVEYTGASFRDPFERIMPEPPAPEPEPEEADHFLESLRIQGIVWNSDQPTAVINGSIMGIGGAVGAAEVVVIGEDGVTLRYKGQETVLRTGAGKGQGVP